MEYSMTKIIPNKYYAILCVFDGKVIDWWKNRVYLGRYVKNAYNKITEKDSYRIYMLNGLTEV